MTGREIRAGRALVGWTQKELATAAGVHPNSVKAWEPRDTAQGEAVDALLEGEAKALTRAAIDNTLEGDTMGLRLCVDRIAPARKDAPVSFDGSMRYLMMRVQTAACGFMREVVCTDPSASDAGNDYMRGDMGKDQSTTALHGAA